MINLFLLCAEALSCLIQKAEREGKITGLKFGRGDIGVSHLFFADDSLVFMEANRREVNTFKEIINVYAKASGQAINFHKSELCIGQKVEENVGGELAKILGVKVVSKYERYLGLLIFVGRKKKEIFEGIKNKVWNKLKGWKGSLFSSAGREVLIKSIIQAIPTYTMSCFKLPKSVINDLHRLAARFWWGSSDEKRRIHWCKWRVLCLPKDRGGLGFRDLEAFNQALLAKQVWRLIRNQNSLYFKVLKACYFPTCDILEAKCGSKASLIWRSFIWGRDVIKKGYRRRIGDGNKVKILKDPWIPRPNNFSFYDQPPIPEDLYVIDMKNNDGSWDENLLQKILMKKTLELSYQFHVRDGKQRIKFFGIILKTGSILSGVATKLLYEILNIQRARR